MTKEIRCQKPGLPIGVQHDVQRIHRAPSMAFERSGNHVCNPVETKPTVEKTRNHDFVGRIQHAGAVPPVSKA